MSFSDPWAKRLISALMLLNSERTVEDGWMGMVFGEVRLAWRALRRSPGFTLVVVMTMGLGIGANTAIFDVVYTVLVQPLPCEDADELVWLRNRYPALGSTGAISAGGFWEFRQNQPAFEGLVAFTGEVANLTGLQTPVQLEEERPGSAPVTVISHGPLQLRTRAKAASVDPMTTLREE